MDRFENIWSLKLSKHTCLYDSLHLRCPKLKSLLTMFNELDWDNKYISKSEISMTFLRYL